MKNHQGNSVRTLHDQGPDEETRQLYEAIEAGQRKAVEQLIASGVNVNPVIVPGDPRLHSTPLIWAASVDDVDICDMLVRAGADVNAINGGGFTALRVAASSESSDACRFLIDAGAHVDAPDNLGETPLFSAVRCGSDELFNLFIEKGADPTATSHAGATPLHYAALGRNVGLTKALLSLGASPNAVARVDGPSSGGLGRPAAAGVVTPLHAALWGPDSDKAVEFCRLLISHGADPSFKPEDATGKKYYSPLQEAIRGRMLKVSRHLLFDCQIDFGQLTNDWPPKSLEELAAGESKIVEWIRMGRVQQHVGEGIGGPHDGSPAPARRPTCEPI